MHLRWQCSRVAILVLGTLAAPAVAGPSYSFTPIGPSGATNVFATGIDNAGDVVGYTADASFTTFQSFLYSGGVYTPINVPGALSGTTQVLAINSQGQYAGSYMDANGMHGFIYAGGNYQTINIPPSPLGALGASVAGLNNHGQALVLSYFSDGTFGGSFLYQNGSFSPIQYNHNGNTIAAGIDNSGDIVGYALEPSLFFDGFLLHNGQYTTFDNPNAPAGVSLGGTLLGGINNLGNIVGSFTDAQNLTHGFLYQNGVFTTLDDPLGVGSTELLGINDPGQLVGEYFDASGNVHAFLATAAVPEPSSLSLIAVTGLAVAGWRLRTRET